MSRFCLFFNSDTSRCKDEAHYFLTGGGAGWAGWLFFLMYTFILHIYYFFTDTKVNMADQSRPGWVVSRTSFKRSLCKRCFSYIYQRYVASAVSLNMQRFKKKHKQGSIIQQAIISYESKQMWFRKLVYENPMSKSNMSFLFLEKHLIAVVLTLPIMWPLRHIH